MNITARLIVAALLVFFAWRGSEIKLPWPPSTDKTLTTPKPDNRLIEMAKPAGEIAKSMMPSDRLYLQSLYDAMAFIVMRDKHLADPVIASTSDFAEFHKSTLQLAIEKKSVGKYPGLDAAIDEVFITIVGPEVRQLDEMTRNQVVAACATLSWVFSIHGES